jgi:hypothetical protein
VLGAAKEPELGLDDAQPVVELHGFIRFSEGQRASDQEFHIGARCLITSIPNTVSLTVRVVHEQTSQNGLLIPRHQPFHCECSSFYHTMIHHQLKN